MPAMTSKQLDRLVRVQEFQSISLVERAFQQARGDDAGDIQDRSGSSRAGDLVADGQLVVGKAPRAMYSETSTPSAAGPRSKCHVDPIGPRWGAGSTKARQHPRG